MLELCIFSGAFLATYFGVRLFRSWTIKRGVLDLPNERSSHTDPTPRGGGLIIALVTLAVYVLASFLIPYDLSLGFLIGALLIVGVSWLDDVYSVPFAWRLLVHSIAALLLILIDGYASSFSLIGGTQTPNIGFLGAVLTFGWIVWLVNAYNFMDGIDGIAGVQAFAAGLGWFILGCNGDMSVARMLGGTIMFVSFAFLLHNWPPAKIFMGDAGSAFLGYLFAALPLIVRSETSTAKGNFLVAGILFVWLFAFDSILTFFRRASRFDKVWRAHREHLYQRLVISGYSHRRTTVLYGLTAIIISVATVIWLSYLSSGSFVALFLAVAISTLLIVALCWKRSCLFGKAS